MSTPRTDEGRKTLNAAHKALAASVTNQALAAHERKLAKNRLLARQAIEAARGIAVEDPHMAGLVAAEACRLLEQK